MRRSLDAYYTPEWAVRVLLDWQPAITRGFALEPCVGDGAIARPLREAGARVWTNDLNMAVGADEHGDATDSRFWKKQVADWIVSNPPFSLAAQIVPAAVQLARQGTAMLLRLSYLEPCENRADWLARFPPTDLLVLPRISFTGDGKTDNVTCAWMIWQTCRMGTPAQRIVVVTKRRAEALIAAEQGGLYDHSDKEELNAASDPDIAGVASSS